MKLVLLEMQELGIPVNASETVSSMGNWISAVLFFTPSEPMNIKVYCLRRTVPASVRYL